MRRSRSGVVVIATATFMFAQEFPQGSLMWYVSRAKAQNQKVVHLSAPRAHTAAAYDFDTAAQNATIVVADVVAQATTYDTYTIYTWYKFKIRERLGPYQRVAPRDGGTVQIPKSLSPLQGDEFIIVESYGTVELAGVTVSIDEPSPSLPGSETRLMFVQLFQDGSAGLQFGHMGEYSVTRDGLLRARIDNGKNPLKKDMDDRFVGRLDQLKRSLR